MARKGHAHTLTGSCLAGTRKNTVKYTSVNYVIDAIRMEYGEC